MTKRATLAAIAAVFTWLTAPAPAHAACEDATTTVEIGGCLEREFRRADAELNAVWKQVQRVIAEADYMSAQDRQNWKEVLREAQRAWIKFKENDCLQAVPYEWFGGSGAGNAAMACQLELTEERTRDLRQRYGLAKTPQ